MSHTPQPPVSGDTVPLHNKLVSASVGALLTSLATTPFELSAAQTLAALVKRDGLRVLWSGLTPSLVMAVPSTALYFTVYEELKGAVERKVQGGAPYAPLVAGIAGRSVTVAVVAPLELVRTVAMYNGGRDAHRESGVAGRLPGGAAYPSTGVLASLRAEIAAGGLSSLWRGLSSTLWRDVPFSGIYWLSYERIKETLLTRMTAASHAGSRGRGDVGSAALPVQSPSFRQTFTATFLAGMVSGSVAAAVTTPFDVIKTRRQVRYVAPSAIASTHTRAASAAYASTSTWALTRQLLAAEGWGGLFSGVQARVAKVAPSCAIMISSYELGKRMLQPDTPARPQSCDRDEAAVTPGEQ